MDILKSKWSKWKDISTGQVSEYRYVLQARRHKNGKIQMRVEHVSNAFNCEKPSLEQLNEIKR